ncbi:MAG: hypothetical protein QM784_18690 [Polyangiaceae bacterium]
MQTKREISSSVLLLAMITGVSGCVEPGSSEPSVAISAESLVDQSVLYLRCNATGWSVDDATRLLPTSNPDLYVRSIDVGESYMTTAGDTCVFVETPELNGWGNWQTYYTSGGFSGGPVNAGSGRYFLSTGSPTATNFRVVYPSTGHYSLLFKRSQSLFTIVAAPSPLVTTPIPVPLYYGGSLDTLDRELTSYYGGGNHPPRITVSVRRGLTNLGDHYGITVQDLTTYGSQRMDRELDLETGTVYEHLVAPYATPTYRITPPARGEDAARYRSALEGIKAGLSIFVQGQMSPDSVAIFPTPELAPHVEYIDEILAKLP